MFSDQLLLQVIVSLEPLRTFCSAVPSDSVCVNLDRIWNMMLPPQSGVAILSHVHPTDAVWTSVSGA